MKNKNEILKIIRSSRSISLPAWGNIAAEHKGENPRDLVTEIDRKVETYLREQFHKIEPETAFAGEETGGDKAAKTFWLVDPIDGTQHFVRGLPFCTTMVAKISNDQVIFSAIYDFVSDKMYHAEAGQGAYIEDIRISVSDRSSTEAFVGYESNLNIESSLEKYLEVRKKLQTVQLVCSGYEHVMVATGKIEGRIGFNAWAQDHDLAPGALLIKEAGGIVTNIGLTESDFDYKNTNYIASNKAVYQALVLDDDAPFPIK